ncbi:MAG TPA: deoxyguanosinetriphosphate triphosphohydrolase [Pseudolabrys sp.]|uniref:deoxyguanosinetriphosphate triphosphohydrolase n=1 Tax=Pseudolabrys sp. TaxID=1960880 RepID=UPI002DDDAD8C|nr:deoxyguanosinetriphosphate triphosphohydrolase [Pseudolabrys sp.]HEV2627287.1 deoxyguanosinetriphosphate triphosphohydrolase [Pseudolabrys sp.]
MAISTPIARAPFAADPLASRGRRFAEPESRSRNDFRRDCDRIIHSAAFRRLAHKTQVFVYHEGDHYRTRLTHTLEVVQIARSLARALGLDEDLAECLALAHDLGHSPFGHAGERALDACVHDYGGFDHNAQALRLVTDLERRYAHFDGLNLTWETLEGLVKHNGPLLTRDGRPTARYAARGVPAPILAYDRVQPLELASFASAEAQVAAIADDVAYDAHDIDDGLRADLFTLEDIAAVPLVGAIVVEIDRQAPRLDPARRVHELIRRLITRMIEEVTAESLRRLAALMPQSVADIRAASEQVIAFSPAMQAGDKAIKGFLYPRMYRHERVMRVMDDAEQVVRDLYGHFAANPADLPAEWGEGLNDAATRARRIADYIAGMTDRYALIEHARLFPATPELR